MNLISRVTPSTLLLRRLLRSSSRGAARIAKRAGAGATGRKAFDPRLGRPSAVSPAAHASPGATAAPATEPLLEPSPDSPAFAPGPGQRSRRHSLLLDAFRAILILAAYAEAVIVGRWFHTPTQEASLFWPGAGVLLGALLLLGMRFTPVIFVITFLAHMALTRDPLIWLGNALGSTLSALVGTFVLRRLFRFNPSLSTPKDVTGLFLIGGLFAPTLAAAFGTLSLYMAGKIIDDQAILTSWIDWWLGDCLGVVMVTPFILTWATRPHMNIEKGDIERILLLIILVAIQCALITSDNGGALTRNLSVYLCFPVAVYVAFKFSPREVATANVFTITFAGVASVFGQGAFGHGHGQIELFELWLTSTTAGATSLIISALIEDTREKENSFNRRRIDVFRVVDAVSASVLVLDRDLNCIYGNRASRRLFALESYGGGDTGETRGPGCAGGRAGVADGRVRPEGRSDAGARTAYSDPHANQRPPSSRLAGVGARGLVADHVLSSSSMGRHVDELFQATPAFLRQLKERLPLARERGRVSFEAEISFGGMRGLYDVSVFATPTDEDAEALGSPDFGRFILQLEDISPRKRAESSLWEAERELRRLLEDQNELISRYTPDGHFTFMNNAFCRYFGVRHEDSVGKSFYDLLPAANREALESMIRGITPEHPITRVEFFYRRPNGEGSWQKYINRGVFGEDGRLLEVQSTGVDITPLRATSDRLAMAENALRGVAEATGETFFHVTREGRILHAHVGRQDLGVYPPKNVTNGVIKSAIDPGAPQAGDNEPGESVYDCLPRELTDLVRRTLRELFILGRPVVRERAIALADGRVRWVAARFHLVSSAEALVMFHDATREKSAELERRLQEERVSFVLSSLQAGLWEWNLATDGLRLSADLRHALGFSDAQGDPSMSAFTALIHPDDRQLFHERILRLRPGAGLPGAPQPMESLPFEFRVLDRHEDWRWVECAARVVRLEDARSGNSAGVGGGSGAGGPPVSILSPVSSAPPSGASSSASPSGPAGAAFALLGTEALLVVGTLVDTSKRRRDAEELRSAKESAEEACRARGQFLANMSHEIRTPMNGVVGMTGLLLGTALSETQRGYVETIRRCGEDLLRIICDVLDLSKIESGKLELERHPFSIRQCLEETLETLAAQAAEKGLDLSCDVASDVPGVIVTDLTRVRQILTNLLSNAIKFTHEGEVSVEVQVSSRLDVGVVLHFLVSDTGIGIPLDRRNRLFATFSQIDASTTRKFGGTGLGLSICRHLTSLLGGQIWVESTVGQGSTFHFTISAASPQSTPPAAAAGSALATLSSGAVIETEPTPRERGLRATNATIAICARRPALARSLRRQLEALGIRALTFASMDELLVFCRAQRQQDAGGEPSTAKQGLSGFLVNAPLFEREFDGAAQELARLKVLTEGTPVFVLMDLLRLSAGLRRSPSDSGFDERDQDAPDDARDGAGDGPGGSDSGIADTRARLDRLPGTLRSAYKGRGGAWIVPLTKPLRLAALAEAIATFVPGAASDRRPTPRGNPVRPPVREQSTEAILASQPSDATFRPAAPPSEPKTSPPHRTHSEPIKVLVAEDNHINQKVISLILRSMSCVPDIAADGLQVLHAVEREDYDLILMDVQMPEMDGIEATRQICRRFAGRMDLPDGGASESGGPSEDRANRRRRPLIIALTACAMEEERALCLEAGMDGYLSKPLKSAEIQKLLQDLRLRKTSSQNSRKLSLAQMPPGEFPPHVVVVQDGVKDDRSSSHTTPGPDR